jgi:hypothetical protein
MPGIAGLYLQFTILAMPTLFTRRTLATLSNKDAGIIRLALPDGWGLTLTASFKRK